MYYNDQTIIYLDGRYIKAGEASTDLYSQTLHYGYGVFEGIRAYSTPGGTGIFKAREHFERMKHSAEFMHIPFNYSIDELIEITYRVLKLNELQDAYIRPLLYLPPNMSLSKPDGSLLMIAAWEWGAYLGEKSLRVQTSSYQRPNPKSIHVEAKTCGHYVNSILASIQAKENGFDEALLLDINNFVAEAPGANLFMEKNGILFTPPPGTILPGITRATVITMCHEMGIECVEKQFTPEELKSADSALFCGTAAEIIGIQSLDDYHFPLPWAESMGSKLQSRYRELVREPEFIKL